MRAHLPPCEAVGADVEAAPALRVGDEAGHGHRTFRHGGQRLADPHIFPVARLRAARAFGFVDVPHALEFGVRVAARRLVLQVAVLGAFLPRGVAVGAEAPGIGFRDEVAALAEEAHMVDLLDGAAGEVRAVLDQILQPGFRGDGLVPAHPAMPRPIRAGPHGVHAGDAADIAGDDAAGGEEEAGERDEAAMSAPRRIVGVAPQRVVVADAVSVVADVVARGLVAPGFLRGPDPNADARAQLVQRGVGDLREQARLGCG